MLRLASIRCRLTGRSAIAWLIALVAFVSLAAVAPLPAAVASGPADPESLDVVRLINGERAYHGLSSLRVDPFLASKARDGAIACPNKPSVVQEGRAKDLALHGGWLASSPHALLLCPQSTILDAMTRWGYGSAGEVLAYNVGFGTGKYTYTYGCNVGQSPPCPGAATYTYSTSGHAAGILIRSSSHRAIILGAYDRIGCGAWISPSGGFLYSCLLSRGGPNGTVAPPVTSPFGGSAPTPAPTKRPTPAPTVAPKLPPTSPAPSAAPVQTPRPSATVASATTKPAARTKPPKPLKSAVPASQSALPSEDVAGIQGDGAAPAATDQPAALVSSREPTPPGGGTWGPVLIVVFAAAAVWAGASITIRLLRSRLGA